MWGSSSKVGLKRLKNNVISIQNRVVPINTPSIMLTFNQIHNLCCLTRLYRYYFLKESSYFHDKYASQHINHNRNTRSVSNNLFRNPRIYSFKFKKSFYYSSLMYWNNLPGVIKNIKKFSPFKRNIKSWLNSQRRA